MTSWMKVPGFPAYEVSDDGQVRGHRGVLKPTIRNRYPSVMLYGQCKPKRCSIHTLMLLAFVGPRPPGMQGMHGDDVPTNNKLSNLAWGTPKQNAADRATARGEKSGASKLTADQICEIRKLREQKTLTALADQFGVAHSTIARACNKSTWGHL
jgi:hypothetical protein